jgi:hypothetical protein
MKSQPLFFTHKFGTVLLAKFQLVMFSKGGVPDRIILEPFAINGSRYI